ncbi:MAG: hypothetical protein CMK74_00470 [Pseudomonadales bacterium]|nr:hypothetical protein [Pseudomonadales bacterium]|tara:strand:+ start:179 stop:538 length:360 start_codon:yes stop_codon:yes gene_type:complete
MARTLTVTSEVNWPLEDSKQAAKLPLTVSLAYTSEASVEKVYTATATDEAVALPMASAKFLLLRAKDNDITVKLNGNSNALTLKKDTGFLMFWNSGGTVTSLTVTVATAPATFKMLAFA